MTAPADHAALRAEVDAARDAEREAFNRYWRVMQHGPAEDHDAALEAWIRAKGEHDALIRAGILITLGPLDDGDPRNGEVQS